MNNKLLEIVSSKIIQVDLAGKIIFANTAACNFLHLPKHKILFKHFNDLKVSFLDVNFRKIEVYDHPITKILNGVGLISGLEIGIKFKNYIHWVVANFLPLFDDNNEIIGVSWVMDPSMKKSHDILYSADKITAKNNVDEISTVIFWESKVGKRKFSNVSQGVKKMLGYDYIEWLKDDFWSSILLPEDKVHTEKYDLFKQNDSSSYKQEYRVVHKNGHWIWVKDYVEVIKKDGKPYKLRGITENISEFKKKETEIERSNSRLEKLINESPFAVSIYDKKGQLVGLNDSCKNSYFDNMGIDYESYNIIDNFRVIEQSNKKLYNAFKRAFLGKPGDVVTEIKGKVKVVSRIKYYSLFDENGNIDYVVFMSEDITEFFKTKELFLKEEAIKQSVFDAIDDSILVVNSSGKIIDYNKKANEVFKKVSGNNPLKKKQEIYSLFLKHLPKNILRDLKEAKNDLNLILEDKYDFYENEYLLNNKWYNIRVFKTFKPKGALIISRDINTRKEIEFALDNSLKKYRKIFNQAPVMIHSANIDANLINVSDYWLSKMGYERNEVIGTSAYKYFSPEFADLYKQSFDSLLNKGEVDNVEIQLRDKEGNPIDVLASSVAEYDKNGRFIKSLTGMTDLTHQKNIERKLKKNQLKLLALHRISKMGSFEYDYNTQEYESSPELEEIFGYAKMQTDFRKHLDLIHEADSKVFVEKLVESVAKGNNFFQVFRIRPYQTNDINWLSIRIMVIKNKDEIIRLIGVVHDITEQRQIESKIETLHDRVGLATQVANLGIWELDLESNELFWEEEMFKIYETDEVIPFDKYREYVVEEDLEHYDNNKISKGEIFDLSITDFRVKINGKIKHLRSYSKMILEDEKPKRLIGVLIDVSKDKQLQYDLEQSLNQKNILNKRFNLALEAAKLGVWEMDLTTGSVYWGNEMYEIYERDTPFSTLEELSEYVYEEDLESYMNIRESLIKENYLIEFDMRVIINEKTKFIRTFTRTELNEKGERLRMIGIVIDITKDKEQQAKLEKSLSEKNTLVKEVHHRVKNNIQLISSIMSLKSFEIEDQNSKTIFSDIMKRIKAMSVIHDRLYAFHNISEIDIAEYLKNINNDLKTIYETNTVKILTQSESVIMDVDKSLIIGMIVSELVSNAIKHGVDKEKGGNVIVQFNKNNEQSTLLVLNSGNTIPDDILDRNDLKGLGMSLIKTFVKQIHAKVQVVHYTNQKLSGFKITF